MCGSLGLGRSLLLHLHFGADARLVVDEVARSEHVLHESRLLKHFRDLFDERLPISSDLCALEASVRRKHLDKEG